MNSDGKRHQLPLPSFMWNWTAKSNSTGSGNNSYYGSSYADLSKQPLTSKSGPGSVGSTSSSGSSTSGLEEITIDPQCESGSTTKPKRKRILLDGKTQCVLGLIFIAALGMLAYNIMECLWQCLKFSHLSGNEFYDDDMRAVLLLAGDHVPVFMVTVFILSSLVCSMAMFYALHFGDDRGNVDRGLFPLYVKFCRFLTYVIMMTFVIQLWTYVNYFPDASKEADTKLLMKVEMFSGRESGTATQQWADTQQSFECCGIDSYKDWQLSSLPRSKTETKPELPLSCCRRFWSSNNSSEDELGTEPVATLKQIASKLAESPKCRPENVHEIGCNNVVLEVISRASVRALIDYGGLSVFHILLIWGLKYIAIKTKELRNSRCYMERLPASVAAAKPFVL